MYTIPSAQLAVKAAKLSVAIPIARNAALRRSLKRGRPIPRVALEAVEPQRGELIEHRRVLDVAGDELDFQRAHDADQRFDQEMQIGAGRDAARVALGKLDVLGQ